MKQDALPSWSSGFECDLWCLSHVIQFVRLQCRDNFRLVPKWLCPLGGTVAIPLYTQTHTNRDWQTQRYLRLKRWTSACLSLAPSVFLSLWHTYKLFLPVCRLPLTLALRLSVHPPDCIVITKTETPQCLSHYYCSQAMADWKIYSRHI